MHIVTIPIQSAKARMKRQNVELFSSRGYGEAPAFHAD